MRWTIVTLGAFACAAITTVASAQDSVVVYQQGSNDQGERGWGERPVPAPNRALELSVGTGYTQGFGMLQRGVSLPDVALGGVGVDLGVGYRLNPHWGIGVSGQYQELDAQRANGSRGVTGTLGGQFHLFPEQGVDPWAELGVGYRVLWETRSTGPDITTHGLQAVRARVGADFRFAPEIALGPFVGADVDVFLVQNGNAINSPQVSTFVMGGIQGRFDVLGTKTQPGRVAAR